MDQHAYILQYSCCIYIESQNLSHAFTRFVFSSLFDAQIAKDFHVEFHTMFPLLVVGKYPTIQINMKNEIVIKCHITKYRSLYRSISNQPYKKLRITISKNSHNRFFVFECPAGMKGSSFLYTNIQNYIPTCFRYLGVHVFFSLASVLIGTKRFLTAVLVTLEAIVTYDSLSSPPDDGKHFPSTFPIFFLYF